MELPADTVLPDTRAEKNAALTEVRTTAPIVPLLLSAVAAAVMAVLGSVGAVVYLSNSGAVGRYGISVGPTKSSTSPKITHDITLEPLLVNLSDEGGKAYLRVTMTLRVTDIGADRTGKMRPQKDAPPQVTDEDDAAIRDTLLAVLGKQTAEGLLSANGKEELKVQLKAALDEHIRGIEVSDLFFTDFLVQR